MLYTTQHTLIKDLTLPEEELFATLGKHLRKHIRKSERDDPVSIRFYMAKEILANPELLDICKHLYEKMFADKGLKNTFNSKLALQYCRQNSLFLSIACLNAERPIGFCAVIYSGTNARAWVSAFDFRNSKLDGHILSRAQRRMNWERLLWCQKLGVEHFDFGGINSFEEPNTIAQFKMEFERENRVTYNNYLVPTNLIGRAALHYFLKK